MKISVYIATSLDGFIAREDGNLDWLSGRNGDDAGSGEDYGYAAFMATVDVLVMGRNTYEKVLTFSNWPYGEKRVVVLSRSLTHLAPNLPPQVALRHSEPAVLVADLATEGFEHIYLDGGQLIQAFLRAGLIDELIITTIPVLIGQGIPLFGRLTGDVCLQHRETRIFAAGFIQTRYRVEPS